MEKMVEVERATQDELRQDLKSLFQGAIRVTLEMVLEEELKAMVGARRFERVGSRKDHRNGTYLRKGLDEFLERDQDRALFDLADSQSKCNKPSNRSL